MDPFLHRQSKYWKEKQNVTSFITEEDQGAGEEGGYDAGKRKKANLDWAWLPSNARKLPRFLGYM
jgi:hypothetical protein